MYAVASSCMQWGILALKRPGLKADFNVVNVFPLFRANPRVFMLTITLKIGVWSTLDPRFRYKARS